MPLENRMGSVFTLPNCTAILKGAHEGHTKTLNQEQTLGHAVIARKAHQQQKGEGKGVTHFLWSVLVNSK
jgi:hypothetical protein